MSRVVLVFASSETADALVAGVPAIARSIRASSLLLQRVEADQIEGVLSQGGEISPLSMAEIARLAPGNGFKPPIPIAEFVPQVDDMFVPGELLQTEGDVVEHVRDWKSQTEGDAPADRLAAVQEFQASLGTAGLLRGLATSGRNILRGTIKPTDGIVSRYCNRPLSTRISALLLRLVWIRPGHATALNALLGIAMLACLLSDSSAGLVAGAVLFQAASMFDGVDGEIARSTFRTSSRGASLDSLTDGLTNLGFIIGLGIALYRQGSEIALQAGLAGFAFMGLGLLLVGAYAKSKGQNLNFDALKGLVRRKPSRLSDWLVWLTMRDFLALAAAILTILGFGETFLLLFAGGSLLWLIAAIAMIGFVTIKGDNS